MLTIGLEPITAKEQIFKSVVFTYFTKRAWIQQNLKNALSM